MTFLVPFDGSKLSEAALARATEYASALDEPVVAVTVVPEDDWGYARERGWIEQAEEFDMDVVVDRLAARVAELAPDAEFRFVTASTTMPKRIARRVGEVADEVRPETVFVGSENAGQVVTPISSVGGEVSADAEYDVHIARHPNPEVAQAMESRSELVAREGGN